MGKNYRESSKPSLEYAIIFRVKASLLQVKRGIKDVFFDKLYRYPPSNFLKEKSAIAESLTEFWTPTQDAELSLEAGKIHNLRIAIQSLNGIEIPANSIFSFWTQIGHPSKSKGYVVGRELRQGCIIPSIGGGLCQLSNALYDAALTSGLEIIERHAHTQIIPGSLAEISRDATIFWNYVDLRFKSDNALRIEAFMTPSHLIIRFKGEKSNTSGNPPTHSQPIYSLHPPDSCLSCGVENCFRNLGNSPKNLTFGRTAYLVDEYWPEFDKYIQSQRTPKDFLGIPLDGKKFKKYNYAWNTTGFQKVKQSALTTFARALESRKLNLQGADRQKNLLKHDRKLAISFAALLSYDVTHVTLMQNLLPFLWQQGYLGGRSFDVLMTRLPLACLQDRLNIAYKQHPESKTLADFRASASLVKAESEALQYARKIITPHTEIANLYKDKAVLIKWDIPQSKPKGVLGRKILFPASTVGRKGAYELRSVATTLNLELVTLGNLLEGVEFWQSVRVEFVNKNWFDEVGLVVLPAFIEHQPRILLEAVSYGIPAIASDACGLGKVKGVVNIFLGDTQSLSSEIQKVISNW